MPLDSQILGHGVYTPREVARLIGESAQQILRWTRGSGPTEPLWQGYYQFLDDSTELSFLDLVELRVVSSMRRAGVSLQSIRYAIHLAQEKFDITRPLSSRHFKTDGKELLMDAIENDGNLVSLSKRRPGQKVFSEIVRTSLSDVEYESNIAARWRPSGHRSIVIDPRRRFGEPILDMYGISTSTIFAEFAELKDINYLSSIYEIPPNTIGDCISYEGQLNRLLEAKDGQGPV